MENEDSVVLAGLGTPSVGTPTVEVLRVSELRDYVKAKWIPKDGCMTCLGQGIKSWKRSTKEPLQHTPCHCLRNK